MNAAFKMISLLRLGTITTQYYSLHTNQIKPRPLNPNLTFQKGVFVSFSVAPVLPFLCVFALPRLLSVITLHFYRTRQKFTMCVAALKKKNPMTSDFPDFAVPLAARRDYFLKGTSRSKRTLVCIYPSFSHPLYLEAVLSFS